MKQEKRDKGDKKKRKWKDDGREAERKGKRIREVMTHK